MWRTMNATLVLSLATLAASCSIAPKVPMPRMELMEPAPYDPIRQDPEIDMAAPPGLIELSFNSTGERLNGLIYLANGPGPHPTVVLLHGYPGNEKNLDLAQSVRRAGYNVMFFHYRGTWGSDGDFGFEHAIQDVKAATDHIRANAATYRADPDRITLVGHSLGGFTALHGAARDPSIACVAGLAPADFGTIASAFIADPDAATGFAAYTDNLVRGPLDGFSGAQALAEIRAKRDRFDLKGLARLLVGKSVMVVAARSDEAVPAEVFHAPLVAAYEAQVGIDLDHALLEGDHSFSWTRFELAETLIDWLDTSCR